jgi:hypothetical protein
MSHVARCVTWTIASFTLSMIGCSASMRYGTGSVDRLAWGDAKPNIVLPEIIDGRVPGEDASFCIATFNTDHPEEMLELREAVQEHAVAAGLVPEGKLPPKAPASEADAEALLSGAATSGAEAVAFLRLRRTGAYGVKAIWADIMVNIGAYLGVLPFVVIFASIPVHEEHAWSAVEAIVLEPNTREVLLRTEQDAMLDDDSVTGWGYGPDDEIRDQIKGAVQKVLQEIAKARQAGWPGRAAPLENGTRVVVFGDPPPPEPAPATPVATPTT